MGPKGGLLPSSNSMWISWVRWGGSSVTSLSTKVSRNSWYLGGTLAATDSCEDCEGFMETVGSGGTGDMEEADRELEGAKEQELGLGRQMSPMYEMSSKLNRSRVESNTMLIES